MGSGWGWGFRWMADCEGVGGGAGEKQVDGGIGE